jgi:hypothetical protein
MNISVAHTAVNAQFVHFDRYEMLENKPKFLKHVGY